MNVLDDDRNETLPAGALVTDDELTAEALAADPEPCLVGARPFCDGEAAFNVSTLPGWYMAAPMSGGRRLGGWRRATAFTFIAALVVIEAFGLCSTYGQFI